MKFYSRFLGLSIPQVGSTYPDPGGHTYPNAIACKEPLPQFSDLSSPPAPQPGNHDNLDTSQAEVLLQTVAQAGLDTEAAREVLASGRFADAVCAEEEKWQAAGISSVPAIVINSQYLLSEAQPVETFEQALLQVAREAE